MLSLRIVKWFGYVAFVVLLFMALTLPAGRPSEAALAPLALASAIGSILVAVFFGAVDRIVFLLAAIAGDPAEPGLFVAKAEQDQDPSLEQSQ